MTMQQFRAYIMAKIGAVVFESDEDEGAAEFVSMLQSIVDTIDRGADVADACRWVGEPCLLNDGRMNTFNAPWVVNPENFTEVLCDGREPMNTVVANCPGGLDASNLIAAAPEMFQILRDALTRLVELGEAESNDLLLPRIDAVLTKAAGATPQDYDAKSSGGAE